VAVAVELNSILGTDPVSFAADVSFGAGANYAGDGSDLRVFEWNGTNWNSLACTFDSIRAGAKVGGVTNFSAYVLAQFAVPTLSMNAAADAFTFEFKPVANCEQSLERSTNLVNWTAVTTITPTNSQSVVLQDNAAPTEHAFYRLRLTIPD
jgi:hypothetical protein